MYDCYYYYHDYYYHDHNHDHDHYHYYFIQRTQPHKRTYDFYYHYYLILFVKLACSSKAVLHAQLGFPKENLCE